jgi:hypothetical protein
MATKEQRIKELETILEKSLTNAFKEAMNTEFDPKNPEEHVNKMASKFGGVSKKMAGDVLKKITQYLQAT